MNYGEAHFGGRIYYLTGFAEATSRLLEETPNYNNKDENGGYLFEMSAPAFYWGSDGERKKAVVYWIFYDKNDDKEMNEYDYDQASRVEWVD